MSVFYQQTWYFYNWHQFQPLKNKKTYFIISSQRYFSSVAIYFANMSPPWKGEACQEQLGACALLKGTSALLSRWTGTSPGTSPQSVKIGLTQKPSGPRVTSLPTELLPPFCGDKTMLWLQIHGFVKTSEHFLPPKHAFLGRIWSFPNPTQVSQHKIEHWTKEM